MIKKGIWVTSIFIFSTLIQLISQIVVTRLFGAKLDLDIFLAAVTIPTIAVTVIYGSLNDAFLPLLGEQKNKHPKTVSQFFISSLITLSLISIFVMCIGMFFSTQISNLLYKSRGEEFVKNVTFQMLFLWLSIPISIIATMFGSYFYLHKQFSRFPITQAIGSITNLILIIFLSKIFGIWALIIAFIANIFIQIFFIIPKEILKNYRFIFSSFNFSNIVPLLIAWTPLIIGTFAIRSDMILIRSFGANLPTGYLVYLNLISKIFSLATGVMTIGIQTLQLPHLVEYIHSKNISKAINVVNKSKLIAIVVSIIVTAILVIFSPIAIHLLFVGGKFTAQDAQITITLLPYFILPAVGWGINSVFFQPLLALKKQLYVGLLNIFAFVSAWTVTGIMQQSTNTMTVISCGLIILLGTGIIGSEIVWQIEKKKLLNFK